MPDDPDDFDDEFDELDDELDDDLDGELGDELSGGGSGGPAPLLDHQETALVEQDLVDLDDFEAAFGAEGYRGVAVFCRDCADDHYFPWEMLRENLQMLLETGETPVHEPAYEPDPHEYVPWDYARGYVDALRDAGVHERRELGVCPQCALALPEQLRQGNFCPRCGAPLLAGRLADALADRGLDDPEISHILHQIGLPT